MSKLRVASILLSDFFKLKCVKTMLKIIIGATIVWSLLVPAAFIVEQVNPHVPIVKHVSFKEGILKETTYSELFRASHESFKDILIYTCCSALLIGFAIGPYFMVLLGVVLAIFLPIALIAFIIELPSKLRDQKKKIRKYINSIKERAK